MSINLSTSAPMELATYLDSVNQVSHGKDLSDIFVKNIFHSSSLEEEEPIVTETAISTVDMNLDLADIFSGAASALSPVAASSSVVAADALIADAALFQGALSAKEAQDKYHLMKHTNAHSRKLDALVDIFRGGVQALSGVVNIGYRPLVIACMAKNIDNSSFQSPSLLGRVTYLLGTACGAVSSLFFSLTAYVFARSYSRLRSFEAKVIKEGDLKEVHDVGNVSKICSFLIEKRLYASTVSTLDKAIKSKGAHQAREDFSKAASRATEKWIDSIAKASGKVGLDSSDLKNAKDLAKKLLQHLDENVELKERMLCELGLNGHISAKDYSFSELLGLELETKAREKKKEVKLKEFVGGYASSLIEKGAKTDLLARLHSTDQFVSSAAMKEAQQLIHAVQEGMKMKKIISIGQVVSATVGILGVIAAALPLSGAVGAALSLVGLVSFLGFFIMDIFNFKYANAEPGPVGKYDKLLVKISSVIGMLSLAASAVCSGLFSCGIIPAAVGISTVSAWLINNLYGYYKIRKKEMSHKMLHPTLNDMADALKKSLKEVTLSDKERQMFKNLSSFDKKRIKSLLLEEKKECRFLDPKDKELDDQHTFAEKYFMLHPNDPAVLRAAEKAWQLSGSSPLRALMDRINASSPTEVISFFSNHLSKPEKTLFLQRLYLKKARKLSSRQFDVASVSSIKTAIELLIKQQPLEKKNALEASTLLQLHALKNLSVA